MLLFLDPHDGVGSLDNGFTTMCLCQVQS